MEAEILWDFFLQVYRDIIDTQHCVSLMCATYLSDAFINRKMITIIVLANISILSPSYQFGGGGLRTFQIYS